MVARRRNLSFRAWICVIAVAASVSIATFPLIENAWASKAWNKTPCWLATNGRTFFYTVGEQRFASSRLNFWTTKYNTDPINNRSYDSNTLNSEQPNDFCWVSPSDPTNVVLRLDAFSSIGSGAQRFVTAGFLLAATLGISVFGFRRRLDRQDARSTDDSIPSNRRES